MPCHSACWNTHAQPGQAAQGPRCQGEGSREGFTEHLLYAQHCAQALCVVVPLTLLATLRGGAANSFVNKRRKLRPREAGGPAVEAGFEPRLPELSLREHPVSSLLLRKGRGNER